MPEFLCNNLVFEKIIILLIGRNVGVDFFWKGCPPLRHISHLFHSFSGWIEDLFSREGSTFEDSAQGQAFGIGAVFIFDKTMLFIDVFNSVKASIKEHRILNIR